MRLVKCGRCGYEWVTKSMKRYVRCPKCGTLRKPIVLGDYQFSLNPR